MTSTPALTLAALALLAGADIGRAEPPEELTAPVAGSIDTAVNAFLRSQSVPGLSLAVVQDARTAYCRGFGATALSGGAASTCDTAYRIASVTKTLTAVAVLQLAEAGKLSLDDPARLYCPEFPRRPVDPTVRHLLTHQSGIRHPTDKEDTTITGEFDRLARAVRFFGSDELAFEPGSATSYSSWGYALLGCVIENAAGQGYMDQMRQRVLAPAGMTATERDSPSFAAANFSPGFRVAGRTSKLVPAEIVDTRFKTPASGLISTAADLARFAAALMDGKLLGPTGLTAMFTASPTTGGRASDYTAGLTVARDQTFGKAYYMAGSMEGTTALLYFVPERKFALAILANRERFAQETAALLPQVTRAVLAPR